MKEMRPVALALAGVIAVGSVANAASIIRWEPERIQRSLAELFVATGLCHKSILVSHNTVDLMWDILELKVGMDVETHEIKERFVAMVDEIEKSANVDLDLFCKDVVKRYGDGGSVLPGVVRAR